MSNLQLNLGMSGYFKLCARKTTTGAISKETPWMQNHITDAGLRNWLYSVPLSGCRVGVGTSEPGDSDTGLDSQIAAVTSVDSWTMGSGRNLLESYIFQRIRFRFAQGVAAGDLTELGIYQGNTLFSRILIKDETGTITPFPVAWDEFLDVTYELRIYQDPYDVTYTAIINGEEREVITRWNFYYGASHYSNICRGLYLGSYYGYTYLTTVEHTNSSNPSGSSGKVPTSVTLPDFQRGFVGYWGLDEGNMSIKTIVCYSFNHGICPMFILTPAVTKTSEEILSLTFNLAVSRRP